MPTKDPCANFISLAHGNVLLFFLSSHGTLGVRFDDPNQIPTDSTSRLLVSLNSIVTALNRTRENAQPMTNYCFWFGSPKRTLGHESSCEPIIVVTVIRTHRCGLPPGVELSPMATACYKRSTWLN